MVRNFEKPDNITINVWLKDGSIYLNKDIPSAVHGKYERAVSFWMDENTLRVCPLDQVDYFEFNFVKSEN